jgi:hypothetical protein
MREISLQITIVFLRRMLPVRLVLVLIEKETTQLDGSTTTLGNTCASNGIQFFKTESLSQARGDIPM